MNRKLGLSAVDDEYFKDTDYQPVKSSKTQILEGWKKGQKHLDLLLKGWREEYLLSIRENLPFTHRGSMSKHFKLPKVGETYSPCKR